MTLIIWQGGKTDVRWAEINFISRGETVSIQFGINFSSFISFIFLSPRGSVARLFSRLHPNVFSLLFCADWHGAVQWELQKMLSPPFFFFAEWLKCQCKMPCFKVFVLVYTGESFCHRTNRESRSSRCSQMKEETWSIFLPYSPPSSLSPSVQFFTCAKGKTDLLFSSTAVFSLWLLLIYTFRASSSSKWELCFPELLHEYI